MTAVVPTPKVATRASTVLAKNLGRTRAFTRIFFAGSTKPKPGQKRGPGKPSDEEKELLRAAIVFSIGALDAYMSEVAAEVLIAQLGASVSPPTQSVRSLLKRVTREIDTLALELVLVTDAAERREVARRAIVEHLTNNVSNHGAKAVAATLERMGDGQATATVWARLDARLSDWPQLATSNRKSPAILDQWTKNRHSIVHEGVAVPVNGDHVTQLIDFVSALAREIDAIAVAALST